jgi:hypothetical protein
VVGEGISTPAIWVVAWIVTVIITIIINIVTSTITITIIIIITHHHHHNPLCPPARSPSSAGGGPSSITSGSSLSSTLPQSASSGFMKTLFGPTLVEEKPVRVWHTGIAHGQRTTRRRTPGSQHRGMRFGAAYYADGAAADAGVLRGPT